MNETTIIQLYAPDLFLTLAYHQPISPHLMENPPSFQKFPRNRSNETDNNLILALANSNYTRQHHSLNNQNHSKQFKQEKPQQTFLTIATHNYHHVHDPMS
jgi:hypothetical protein